MEEIMNIIYEKWDEILETVKTEHELSDVSFKNWLKLYQQKVRPPTESCYFRTDRVRLRH